MVIYFVSISLSKNPNDFNKMRVHILHKLLHSSHGPKNLSQTLKFLYHMNNFELVCTNILDTTIHGP
jgi:hypothetical protein